MLFRSGRMNEVVKLIYRDNDVVFVSVHALHKISRYKSKEAEDVKINKLGSKVWQNLKASAKSKVKDIAKDLIKLYAKRKASKGFAFSADTYLQQELESSFIYEDTPDQEKAIIADAILSHRASNKVEPHSIYGKIVADADRDLIPIHIIERTILFSLEKFPGYDKDEHFIRSKEHIEIKYGWDTYMKLWLDSEVNDKRLKKLRYLIKDEDRFKRVFDYYLKKHINIYKKSRDD